MSVLTQEMGERGRFSVLALYDRLRVARAAIPLGTRGSRVDGPNTRDNPLGGVPRQQKMLKGQPTQSHISPCILVHDDSTESLPRKEKGGGWVR